MGTFATTKNFKASQEFIPFACSKIKNAFESEGFEYSVKSESYNKTVISVTKGNLVKQVVGLKQGLEIGFSYGDGNIFVNANGTVIKDQAIASALMLFVAWPVLIPQIIGLINQSKLDEKAMVVVEAALNEYNKEQPIFCTHCGHIVNGVDGKCPKCGNIL